MRMLKLQEKLSSSGVMAKSLAISRSGSVPRLRSMVIFSPSRPISLRTSEISRIFPALTRSANLAMMASTVVVGGISVMSMQLDSLS